MKPIRKLLLTVSLCSVLLAISGCALFTKNTGETFSKMATISEAKAMLPYYQMKVSHVIASDVYRLNFYFYCISPERTQMAVYRSDQVFLRFKNGKEMMYNPCVSRSGVKVNDDYYRFDVIIDISKEDLKYCLEMPIYSVEWVPSMSVYTEMELPMDKYINMAEIISDFVFQTPLTPEREQALMAPQKTLIDESKWDY